MNPEVAALPIDWNPPAGWATLRTIDLHTAGEPLRVVVAGVPALRGDSILARRDDLESSHDYVRQTLMGEPRGHADMYGCILTPPVSPGAHAGVLFMHNDGYSTMCGHGIIAVGKLLVEAGAVPPTEPLTEVRLDTPAGLVVASVQSERGQAGAVSFRNVPSWAELDQEVKVPGVGTIPYDLGYGGAFYAYVRAEVVGLTLAPAHTSHLIETGMAIKRAVQTIRPPEHPDSPELSFLYGTIFVGPPNRPAHHSRNVCVFAEGEVDRSPTGTGLSGRLAIHHARGEVALDQTIVVESILGTTFKGRIREITTAGPHEAVIPEVEGHAWITGRHEFLIDPDDPYGHGFFLR